MDVAKRSLRTLIISHCPDTSQWRVNVPVERSKRNGSLRDIAHVAKADAAAKENSQCDETSEPEGHSRSISSEKCISVIGKTRELVDGRESEVCCCDQAVYAAEEEEIDLGGRHVAPVVGPPVGDCK